MLGWLKLAGETLGLINKVNADLNTEAMKQAKRARIEVNFKNKVDETIEKKDDKTIRNLLGD